MIFIIILILLLLIIFILSIKNTNIVSGGKKKKKKARRKKTRRKKTRRKKTRRKKNRQKKKKKSSSGPSFNLIAVDDGGTSALSSKIKKENDANNMINKLEDRLKEIGNNRSKEQKIKEELLIINQKITDANIKLKHIQEELKEKEKENVYQELKEAELKESELKEAATLKAATLKAAEIPERLRDNEYIKEWLSIYNFCVNIRDEIDKKDDIISYCENDNCEQKSENDCIEPCRKKNKSAPMAEWKYRMKKFDKCYSKNRFKTINNHKNNNSIFKSKFNNFKFKIIDFLKIEINDIKTHTQCQYYIFQSEQNNNNYYYLFSIGSQLKFEICNEENKSLMVKIINPIIINLISLIKKNTNTKFIFCGHSMGSSIILHIAYKLKTKYIGIFNNNCIFIGSGFVRYLPIKNVDELKSPNIFMFLYAEIINPPQDIYIDIRYLMGTDIIDNRFNNNNLPTDFFLQLSHLLNYKNQLIDNDGNAIIYHSNKENILPYKYKSYEPFYIVLYNSEKNNAKIIEWEAFKINENFNKIKIFDSYGKSEELHKWAKYEIPLNAAFINN
jgi:hypothetical protein